MKKRAFTLTELLVVVVIIGVLSAVVLPKFTKVLQTRKTTEAENVMAAVRNEQEARCMIGRNYTADTAKLAALPKATSKNYTYTLDAQGITATAKDGNYTLQIPSYTDGRICCSGEGCAGLNKDYPKCGEIPDLETATCEAPDVPEPACNLSDYTRTCQEEGYGAEYTGSVTYTVNADCTGYTKADSCTKQASGCEPTERDLDECDHYGGHWDYNSCACVPNCDVKDPQISEKKAFCDDPDYYYYEGTWNMDTCSCDCPSGTEWKDGQGCMPACDVKDPQIAEKKALCDDPDYYYYEGTWNMNTCRCDCPSGTTWKDGQGCVPGCERTRENEGNAQSCEQPQDPTAVAGTWAWEGANACKCICPEGYELDKYGQCIKKRKDCYTGIEGTPAEQDIIDCQRSGPASNGTGDYVPGWWGDNGDGECRCHCPPGTESTAQSGGWCIRYNCTGLQGVNATTSNFQVNCMGLNLGRWSCAPYGYPNIYGIRGTSNLSDEQLCQPNQYRYAKGRWDDSNCHCDCPKGSYLQIRTGYCIVPPNGTVTPGEYFDYDDWEGNVGDDNIDLEEVPEWSYTIYDWGDEIHTDDSWDEVGYMGY